MVSVACASPCLHRPLRLWWERTEQRAHPLNSLSLCCAPSTRMAWHQERPLALPWSPRRRKPDAHGAQSPGICVLPTLYTCTVVGPLFCWSP